MSNLPRMTHECMLCIDQKGRKKLDRARGPMKHLKVDKQIDCCYLCYWFKEDMETGDIYETCIHPDFTEPKSIWDGSKIPEWCPLSEVA